MHQCDNNCILFFMNDINLIKNILSLSGVNNPNLDKTLRLIDSINKINSNGLTKDGLIDVAAVINPKIKPLISLIKEQQKSHDDDFVQYNRPDG